MSKTTVLNLYIWPNFFKENDDIDDVDMFNIKIGMGFSWKKL